jgi:pimeloyl-ACP methyl ester carboxylesterase
MEKSIEYERKKITYRIAGAGPAVILIHGFGEDGTIWNDLAGELHGYQILVPDLPGSGRSEMIGDMSMEGLADCLQAILQQEGITTCVMIGHSMGGYITLAFAYKYAAMLSGFGLFHSSAFADTEEKKNTRRKGIKFIQENGAFTFLKTLVPNLYSPATKEQNTALIEKHLQSVTNSTETALTAYYYAMINRKDHTDVLKETALPVLFIFGKWDTAVLLEDGLKQAHLPQLSYVHILSRSAHMGMAEELDNAALILNQFLSDTL